MDTLHLVIVEDEEAHLQLLRRAVSKEFPQAAIHHFPEARSCLEAIDRLKPDLIIADYLMPGMSGLEFLEKLRLKNVNTPVIMITGQGDEGIAVRALKLGAADYLVKTPEFFKLVPGAIVKVLREQRLADSLRDSELRFRSIYEKSPIGIMILDKRGMILDANRASLDLLGIPESANLGNFNLFDDRGVPEGSLDLLCEGQTVRYETRFDFGKAPNPGFFVTPASGAAHFDVQVTPLMENRSLGGYLLQVQDITLRKRAEQALEISHRFLEAANRSGGLYSLVEDFARLAKRFTGCSVAAILIPEQAGDTLCKDCEFFGAPPGVSRVPPSAPRDTRPCIDAIRGVTSPIFPFYTKSGSFYTNSTSSLPADIAGCGVGMAHGGGCTLFAHESVALVPIKLGDSILGLIRMADPKKDMLSPHALEVLERAALELGTAIQRLRATEELRKARDELEMRVQKRTQALASANDKLHKEIEERIRAQEALSKSAEDLKLFAYSIMHDLKSPTIGIHGLTKLLYRQHADKLDEKGRNYCEQILRASEYSLVLVDQINSYIAAKESPLNIEAVKLSDLLKTVMEEFSARLSARQVRWIQPDCDVKISVDRLSMTRLLTNLVDNSLKYGGDALSEIRVGFEETGDSFVLTVSDDGAGMNKEDCKAIFRPFQRTENAAGISGTGLGLNIVREIARRHGGAVEVNCGPEGGMVFRISIGKPL